MVILLRRISFPILLALACSWLWGCVPAASSNAEENEAHFLKGKARVSGMDYRGAIESFEEALVVNPQSAAAHFELGWLFAEKEPDPATAIYHYQKYLQLRPSADNAEVIHDHILRLRQDLAKGLMPLPGTPSVQREFEQLAEENHRLHDELDRMKGFLASRGLSITNPAPNVRERSPAVLAPNPGTRTPGSNSTESAPRNVSGRTHKVQSGESPSSIARKYGVKVEALLAANPSLNPRRMQVGQIIQVPNP